MAKENLTELSTDSLILRKKNTLKRLIGSAILLSLFTLYLLYLDLIKHSENNHTETYIFIAIGITVIAFEAVYKISKVNAELKRRQEI